MNITNFKSLSKVILLCVCLGSASTALGFNVVFQATGFLDPDSRFQTADGAFTNGIRVTVGSFNPGFDVAANATDFNALVENFNEFAATVSANGLTRNIAFDGSVSFETVNVTGELGSKLYAFAYFPDNISGVTEFGLFSSTDAAWLGLGDGAELQTTLTTDLVDQAFFGSLIIDGSNHLRLAVSTIPIPEPSTYFMMGLGGLALAVIYRRRK